MRVKIVNVDLYGFQGRSFHPTKAHEGLTATVFKVYSETYDDGTLLDDELAEQQARDSGNKDHLHVLVLYEAVVDDSGEVLTLADHEIKILTQEAEDIESLIEAATTVSGSLHATTVPTNQWPRVAYELQFLDMALVKLKKGSLK